MNPNVVHTKAFSFAGTSNDIEGGFTHGSIHNTGNANVLIQIDDSTIVIKPSTVYNFDYVGKAYPAITVHTAGTSCEAVFHY